MDAIVELKKSLVKETGKADLDAERITDILTQLGETTVTVEILQSTGIGKVLAKLRKSIKNESIAKKCKDVCKGWKNQVTGGAVAAKAEKISKTKVAAPKVERRMSGFGVQLGTYDSAKRNKVQKLIWEALGARPAETEKKETTTAGAEGDDAEEKFVNVDWNLSREEVTVRIEAAMFAKFGVSKEYTNKYRDLAPNLKDSNNPDLNINLYKGTVSPEEVIELSGLDLASEEVKSARADNKKWFREAARSDYNKMSGATDMFKCEKCGKSKTRYFQMQTRGADEPMTVFVTCLLCGHKFRGGDNA